MLYTWANKICQHLGSSLETQVLSVPMPIILQYDMHILNKENTR